MENNDIEKDITRVLEPIKWNINCLATEVLPENTEDITTLSRG